MIIEDDDRALDAMFAAARDAEPGAGLVARVLADAAAVQRADAAMPVPDPAATRAPVGRLAGLLGVLGGWSAVSGITAAGIFGLAVGLYAPDEVDFWLGGGTLGLGSAGDAVTPDLGELGLGAAPAGPQSTEGDDV